MYQYAIKFPITVNSWPKIEEELGIELSYDKNSECYEYFGDEYYMKIYFPKIRIFQT